MSWSAHAEADPKAKAVTAARRILTLAILNRHDRHGAHG